MREIKFRQPVFIDGKFDRFHYWGFMDDGFIAPIGDYKNKGGQFTNLKDKNGVEIFESDYIRNESGRIGEVVWHEYAGCWDTVPIKSTTESQIGDAIGFENNQWCRHVEKVGNEYEGLEDKHGPFDMSIEEHDSFELEGK